VVTWGLKVGFWKWGETEADGELMEPLQTSEGNTPISRGNKGARGRAAQKRMEKLVGKSRWGGDGVGTP